MLNTGSENKGQIYFYDWMNGITRLFNEENKEEFKSSKEKSGFIRNWGVEKKSPLLRDITFGEQMFLGFFCFVLFSF